MPHSANENFETGPPTPTNGLDAHGRAALILSETILHALVETGTLTIEQAVSVVTTAHEVTAQVARAPNVKPGSMQELLTYLERIGASLETDIR